MPKLEVRCEQQSLRHGNVAPRLEHHHCNRSSRKSITNYEFSNNVEANLLVRDGLDDTNRQDVEK